MPVDQNAIDIAHIAIAREPDAEAERRRRNAPPPPPRIADRSMHGAQLAEGVFLAESQAVEARRQAGIDPSKLLVVEFTSFGSGARAVFEDRFGAVVVDERMIARRITRTIAIHPAGDDIAAISQRVAASVVDQQILPSAANLRMRKASSEEIEKAIRAGSVTRQENSISQSNLIVIETQNGGADTDDALRFLGLSPIATSEEDVELSRILVQFPTIDTLHAFEAEVHSCSSNEDMEGILPPGLRRDFFDALDWAGPRDRNDRMGARLRREGFSTAPIFAIDVDLWHPGTEEGARIALNEFREYCRRLGGSVKDDLRTSSLVLARVLSPLPLAEALLDLDIVAQVNLPPVLPPTYSALFTEIPPLPDYIAPDGSEPIITLIDSGVLSGHPLLRGWVLDERDFDSGEGTVVDQHGHGTQVAGLLVYGDIAHCLDSGQWTPRAMIASAKVLRRDQFDGSRPVFPENHRPERIVSEAIRYFHREDGSRVFNLSIGNPDDIYTGGRQFAWAEVLDQIARELDVLIITSAGNISTPPLPDIATTREGFQVELRDLILASPQCRLCSPATAGIVITVGALARSEYSERNALAGAPAGAPAPFSRVGPGYAPKETQGAIKPEFVAFGGNFAIRNWDSRGPAWVRNDIQLGEPTTRLNNDGDRMLTSAIGTSFATPHVSFASAIALQTAARTLGNSSPSANSARALLGSCTHIPSCGAAWLHDPEELESWDKMRLVGYGQVDTERLAYPLSNDVCLLAEDIIPEDHWHLYSIGIPPAFRTGHGNRGITVSLAFDPPVRASRKDYLARTMWVEALKGLTTAEIIQYRSRSTGIGNAVRLPTSKLLAMRPTTTEVEWSTLQVRRYSWPRAPSLPCSSGGTEPTLHFLVGCKKRFPSGDDPNQGYSLAIRFWHLDTQVQLREQLYSRVRVKAITRLRVEPRG